MKYRVIKKYETDVLVPIELKEGDKVEVIKESDPNGDWPNWIYSRKGNIEGWVPKQIMKIKSGIGEIMEDYIATEFSVYEGEIIIGDKELNGWIWGFKEKENNRLGWTPLNCLVQCN